jgi:hypothetical protein
MFFFQLNQPQWEWECHGLWSIHTIRIYPNLWLCYGLLMGLWAEIHGLCLNGDHGDHPTKRPHSEKQFNTPEQFPAPHHALDMS